MKIMISLSRKRRKPNGNKQVNNAKLQKKKKALAQMVAQRKKDPKKAWKGSQNINDAINLVKAEIQVLSKEDKVRRQSKAGK